MRQDLTHDSIRASRDEADASPVEARAAGPGVAAARNAYARYAAAAEFALNTVTATAARNQAGLRALTLRGFAAADVNIRAGFDCAERMARAARPQDVLDLQASFLRDQTRRSLQQAMDLQRMAADLLRAALPGAKA